MKKIISLFLGTIISLAIILLNIYLIFPWFLGTGPINIGSIEVSYVSMARFIVDFYPDLSFGPYWYFGFPFSVFYTPLLPFFEAIVNQFFHVPLWQAYRIVTGTGLVLAPVGLFLFAWYLTKKIVPAGLAAVCYTFLPTIFDFILSSNEVANDTLTRGALDPRRLVMLARWGEGPHMLSLVFIPLAGLFFSKSLKNQKMGSIIAAALFSGLTALTNAVGLYGLLFLLLAVFWGQLIKDGKKWPGTVKTGLLTAVVSYGLIAWWYNLTFIKTFFAEGGGIAKTYLSLFPWGIVIAVLIIIGLHFFFRKVIKNKAITVSFLWFFTMFIIVYVYYVSAPPEFSEQRLQLAPQALRLIAEADMAGCLFVASLLAFVISVLEKKNKILGIGSNILGILLIGLVLSYGVYYLPFGQEAVSGQVDLAKTGEYRISSWLADNVEEAKGERVLAAGNYGFYLNWFTDVWQLRGGLYQAMTHYWPEHIYYQLTHGKSSQLAVDWLKIGNIKYIVVNTPASRELYKEYKYPEKFSGLQRAYSSEGDIIYQVPLVATSPAKIVNKDQMKNLQAPAKADDTDPIKDYVSWLDTAKPAEFRVVDNDHYQITAAVNQQEAVLVQMTYDSGFRARSSNGQSIKIVKDPLDFMVLLPSESQTEINLAYAKTWDVWLGYLITIGTIIYLIVYALSGSELWKRY